MTPREIGILNSLVTLAVESMPDGLSASEREVAQIVGAWTIDGVPVRQVCPHCLDVAPPFGEGRKPWLQFHMDDPIHRMWWAMKKRMQVRWG